MQFNKPLHSDHCDALVADQEARFIDDYARHAVAGVSKPKSIGMPFILRQPVKANKGTTGVLLVHGLMAAPEEVAQWAEHLFQQGYTVYAVRLVGHGTTPQDLESRHYSEWLESVNQGQAILQTCCDNLIIAGFSTGAALSLLKVIEQPHAFSAVISISAPVKMASFSANFAGLVNNWNKLMARVSIHKFAKRFATNHPDNPHINYPLCPVNSVVQMQTLMRKVKKGLPSLRLPILVMHADKDPKINVNSAKVIFKKSGAMQKRYKIISFNQHGIVRGEISKQVFREVDNFLDQVMSGLK
jgi:esterase/lipase